MCYWFVVSVIAWGALALVGVYWWPLRGESAATILLAGGIGCAANWFRNRTFHCGITGPLFLISGILFLLSRVDAIELNARVVWPIILIGAGIAFLLEWRYARRTNC